MPAIADLSVANWHRLNRLLEEALALEAEARAAWLQRLPATESDLLPLLQRLLTSKDLSETAEFVAAPRHVRAEIRNTVEQAGRPIGPYRLVRELGQGGMGTVWLAARADGAFERQVALKLPHAERTDRGLAQRFARERAVLASLNHPNIARLLDAGWSESGRPYLALEYVDGQPITDWCAQQQLDCGARLALCVTVIRAVAHAHARLVVHRDLKPSNVLVTVAGEVKLLDFGIAKLLAAETTAAEETELTRMAGRALTPGYSAPEQILGQPISTATDIYALGVLLFELLTGERPYRLRSADAQGRSALEESIVRVDAPAPSAMVKDKAIRRLLRGDLDAIVLRALKKAPEQRYDTAAAFADDIERYLRRLPVHAQRDSRTYRLSRFIVRNRFAVSAVSAVIVALAVGLSVALWQATVAREEAARATIIKDFVLSIIQQADPVASRQTREADIALLATAESRIERELESEPELALQMRRAIGAAYINRGEFLRARTTLRKGIEQARTKLPPGNFELLGAFVQMADEYVMDGAQTTKDLEGAIDHLRDLGPSARPLLADALTALVRNKRWTVSWGEVVTSAKEAYRAALASDDEGRVLEAVSDLGYALFPLEEDPAELLKAIAEGWEFGTRSGRIGPADPRRIIAMSWYGFSLCHAGRKEECLGLCQDAVDAARKYHGSVSRAAEVALGVLGFAFDRLGDPKRALEPTREAYAITVKREPPESENRSFRMSMLTNSLFELDLHEEVRQVLRETPIEALKGSGSATATPVHNLWYEAGTRLRLGELETAERLAEEALLVMEAQGPKVLSDWVYGLLARVLYENGKPERAETFAVASVQHGSDFPSDSERAWKLLRLSLIRLELAKYQSALELADEALALYSAKGSPNAKSVAQVNYQRGRALFGLGRYKDAIEALSAAHAHWHKSNPGGLAEAGGAYWYGQALVASGESTRGKALIAAAAPRLAASPNPRDRALVAGDKKPVTNAR